MTNSEIPFLPNSPRRSSSRGIAFIFLFLAFCGFADAGYLAVEHYLQAIPPCTISAGCEKVLVSQYAVVWGVPVALIGSLYYLALFLFAVAYVSSSDERLLRFTTKLTPLGFAASLWFVYLQFFVIHAICIYCLLSATTSTLLFAIGMSYLVMHRGSSSQVVS